MTRDELLRRLNLRASQRDNSRVTRRALRDWVVERLVPGPIPRGRRRGVPIYWDWPRLSYWRALQICCLKSQGARRFAQIRLGLWFRGAEFPIPAVRRALLGEFRRLRKRLRRQISTTYDPRSSKGLSPKEARSLVRQFGKLSPSIVPEGFAYPDQSLITAYETTAFGVNPDSRKGGSSEAFRRFAIDTLDRFGIPIGDIPIELRERGLSILEAAFTGMLGDPAEIECCAEDTIQHAPPAAFHEARALARHSPRLLRRAVRCDGVGQPSWLDSLRKPLGQVADTMRLGPWQIIAFVLALHVVHRAGWLPSTRRSSRVPRSPKLPHK